jgi:acetyl coenzyme A synthetase (ADP forming)-like protein
VSAPTKSREQIERLFYPGSVAVVGTNRVKGTVPHDIFFNILRDNFQGVLYPVSPRERSVAGVKAYKYVVDIEDPVDMAVIVFPSSVCHLALEQCGQKGIRSAIIISAGFREIGPAGAEREAQLQEIAGRYGISFIGPNCLGVINTDPAVSFNASFARAMPEEGSIAFLSQSGALCTAVLDYARGRHIGFSKFVSFGNKADVTEIDLLDYLKDDPKTRVILLYLEEVTDGRALMQAARRIIEERGKPVLVLKSGRTREGAKAAASHTGSLAGSDQVCDAAFRQAGILRCDTVEDLFNQAIALAYQPVPQGRRVAIVTNAGGPGVLATDRVVREGLELASFSEATAEALKKSLPGTANLKNPVDVIGDAKVDRYGAAMSAVLADEGVDGALVILTPQSMTDIGSIAREVCRLAGDQEGRGSQAKPLYTSFMGERDVAEGADILQRHRIPQYALPEDMCQAFAGSHRFGRIRERLAARHAAAAAPALGARAAEAGPEPAEVARELLEAAEAEGRTYLPMPEAFRLLAAYGLPVLPYHLARSAAEAREAAGLIGFPVALKAVSEQIAHKSEAGGVVLGVRSKEEAAEAFHRIEGGAGKAGARLDGVLVQRMAAEGQESFLGMKRDPSFGAAVLAGLGGLFVELVRDVSFRIPPFGEEEALEMLRELALYPLLAGARGRPERDLPALAGCILAVARIAQECPQIEELDINPLFVHDRGSGCAVADARIVRRQA